MKPINGEIKPYAILLQEQARRAENEERLKARGERIGGWGLILLVIALLIAGASSGCASDLDDADRVAIFEARGQEIAAAVWEHIGAPGPMPRVTFVPADACGPGAFFADGACRGGVYNPREHSMLIPWQGADMALPHEMAHAHLFVTNPTAYSAYEAGHKLEWWWGLVEEAGRATALEMWR